MRHGQDVSLRFWNVPDPGQDPAQVLLPTLTIRDLEVRVEFFERSELRSVSLLTFDDGQPIENAEVTFRESRILDERRDTEALGRLVRSAKNVGFRICKRLSYPQ